MKKKNYTPLSYDSEKIILLLSAILDHISAYSAPARPETYLDSADVKRLLNISDSTLYRLRKTQQIPAIRMGGKIYCPQSFFDEKGREWF